MVESIKTYGILHPIIVRTIDNSTYEVLSGHNRVRAAKAAGLLTVPAIIREHLTDEEAMLIVTESNLKQRSFTDLSHSERAVTIAAHYEAIKKQGVCKDLLQDIENMLKPSNINESEASGQAVQKIDNRESIGDKYDMSGRTVARYLRINQLIETLKERLDIGEFAVLAAVSLSYLPDNQQEIVEDVLSSGNYKINMNKAEALRLAAEKKPLSHETVEQIIITNRKVKSAASNSIKLNSRIVAKYFQPEQKKAEIEKTIEIALEFYYTLRSRKAEVFQQDNMAVDSDSEFQDTSQAVTSGI